MNLNTEKYSMAINYIGSAVVSAQRVPEPDPLPGISFEKHPVAGDSKHRVLPNISGKPKVPGTTRYFGYHP